MKFSSDLKLAICLVAIVNVTERSTMEKFDLDLNFNLTSVLWKIRGRKKLQITKLLSSQFLMQSLSLDFKLNNSLSQYHYSKSSRMVAYTTEKYMLVSILWEIGKRWSKTSNIDLVGNFTAHWQQFFVKTKIRQKVFLTFFKCRTPYKICSTPLLICK